MARTPQTVFDVIERLPRGDIYDDVHIERDARRAGSWIREMESDGGTTDEHGVDERQPP
jgi:hypothetical protein